MKKLATLAILLTSPPLAANCFQAGDVGFGHLLVNILREEQRDVDVDAFADSCWIAGMPSAVPGILIITFSRPTAFHSRRASSIVPWCRGAR